MIVTDPKERDRFLRFAVVGIIGAVVDFGVFNLLTATTSILPVYASIISFTAAVVSNFAWNRFWTYPDSRSKKIHHQLVQFGVISLVGLGIRTPLFAYLEKVLVNFFTSSVHLDVWILTPRFLGHNMALAIAIIVVMFWNFFANRYWTYSDID